MLAVHREQICSRLMELYMVENAGTPNLPRYCAKHALPPYSYVSGVTPHPTSDPRGHSFGVHAEPAEPLEETSFRSNATYLYAIDLFNHGFYWEAHEAWEALWHAAGRRGATADFLKGLIKLAAAGVKVRQGKPVGVRKHAGRAAELFQQTACAATHRHYMGLELEELICFAADLSNRADRSRHDANGSAEIVFDLLLQPR
jgi:uncharacterized protein